ncbi:MAG TPA: peptidoglycan DD-metalloendopeptidase family protein [Bacillaceae bacterium]
MKRSSLLSVTMAATLGFGGLLAGGGQANATTLSELQNQQSEIQNKKSDVNNSIGEKNSEISEIATQQGQLEAEMKKIENTIADTNNKIQEKQKQIEDTKAEIERLKAEIEVLKDKIEKRNELLKERARNIQTNGGSVNYIDVLLGAESFGDFIDRVSAVTTLVNADKQIIEEQKRDKEQLEASQAEVEKKLASLEGMLKELESLKADLKVQQAKKAEIMKQLADEKKHLEAEKMSLEEEAEVLNAQNAALQKAIQNEKNRIAEAERKAREEAARRAREAAASKKPSGGGSHSSSHSVSSGPTYSAPPVSSGMFMRPAMGYISSGFGGRSLGNHFGIDIAAKGTVPVVAAADGVVSSSYTSSSYGNVVFVVHHINGQMYTTVYAHLRSRSVSAGQSVSKGQLLGYMGNTGQSYGQHLHFELHVGGWNAAKSNAVDPRKYINF